MWNKHSCFLWEGFCKIKLSWIVSLFHNQVVWHEANLRKRILSFCLIAHWCGQTGPLNSVSDLTQYSHPLLFLCCIIFKWMVFHIATIARPELVILTSFYAKPCKFFWRHGIHIPLTVFVSWAIIYNARVLRLHHMQTFLRGFTLHRCLQGRNLQNTGFDSPINMRYPCRFEYMIELHVAFPLVPLQSSGLFPFRHDRMFQQRTQRFFLEINNFGSNCTLQTLLFHHL